MSNAVREALAAHVEFGAVPGAAALVAYGDDAHVVVVGAKAVGDVAALERDAIFRIASLSKPIAAAAAMILVDEGILDLDAPVKGLLPELAHRRVLRRLEAELDETVPAQRPITLEDLLTLRLGFGSVMAPPDTYPIQRAEAELALRTLGPPWPPTPHPPDEWIRRFATLPLMEQPGERWLYNTGIQVLGVLLGRATDASVEELLSERIFAPLGMRDTGFSVSPAQMSRFTTAYHPDPDTGALHVNDAPPDSFWSRPPVFADVSGWLVSTLDDYWSFVRMLLAEGVHGDRRILSASAVQRMTTDHLNAAQRAGNAIFLGDDGGWGYGMRAPASGSPPAVPGGFGWDGGSGTTWRSDPRTGLTGILLTQCEMTSSEPPAVFVDFWNAVDAGRDV